MNDHLYSHLFIINLRLKNIFKLKDSTTFANLLMEKPGNWIAIAKKSEHSKKKEILRKVSASLLKI